MPSSVRFLTVRMFSLLLLLFIHLRACHSSPSIHPLCHDEESHALLQFKQSLVINESASSDPSAYPKVASWKVDGDCCSWDGVECDRDSGHVIGLDLSSSFLYGSINSNSTLFHLVHLGRLNLADNDFNNSEIPSEIRNLPRLFDLNLSQSSFSGQIPEEILQLSKLVSIDLRLNSMKLRKPGLQHLVESLTNLEVLHLSEVDISAKSGSQLETLLLEGTNFSGQLPESIGNLKSLKEFHAAECYFSGAIPSSLGNLTKLNSLDLSYNSFSGKIPSTFVNLLQLTYLSLSSNNFSSGTLHWLCNLTNLNSTIGLSQTNSYGEIPSCLGNLTQLAVLKLGENKLAGQIPESIFRLPNLETLYLHENLFRGTVNVGLLKSKSLVSFQINYNNLSVIGNSNDSVALPKFQILGFEQSVDILPWNNLRYLGLSGNKLEGALPIPPRSTIIYQVSNNRLTGEIPQAICNLTSLVILQLSNNSFSGDIPDAFSSDCTLREIDFSQNQLEGKIPRSLANCTKLEFLNIEKNKITDVFPSWLGIFPKLRVLILRSNRLHGVIGKPRANFEFQRLQIVDLSGPIPRGNQFDTFDRTSFDANPGLCGKPLSRKCGNGEDSLPAAKRDEGSAAYPLEFGWKVVVTGYASGLVIGVILGCVMDTRKYEWLVKNYFARWQR
ncbi:hypothetical protein OIU77_017303 [Salix suchowensis]|uniref:Leucine-rich repeat-containing N-terminal plant-type domain-containing protein n=1 Tax=Salix suchowensis TaxID=1278906 RepID=A0ABQ8ZNJ1_9ROSI|nr:hypothetical protein OIU77_017303 [Salix suchowensis]